jgi:hypothetical protein
MKGTPSWLEIIYRLTYQAIAETAVGNALPKSLEDRSGGGWTLRLLILDRRFAASGAYNDSVDFHP